MKRLLIAPDQNRRSWIEVLPSNNNLSPLQRRGTTSFPTFMLPPNERLIRGNADTVLALITQAREINKIYTGFITVDKLSTICKVFSKFILQAEQNSCEKI